MADHSHDAYEVHGAATNADIGELRSHVEGLRFDLGQAEERIRELEIDAAKLRRDLAELREQADEIADLKHRVQTLVSVLASHLAGHGLAPIKALGEIGDPDV